MRYSIGDVSRVLGITTSALHFYEKEGIIETPKEESGRRYYENVDVNRLVSAKKYRSMGVSLKEIASQFGRNGMSSEQVIARMREKMTQAQRLSREYAELAGDIERLIAHSERVVEDNGQVDICRAEDMLALCNESGGIIPHDRQQQHLAQQWLEVMPAVSVSILKKTPDDAAAFSLMIPASRACNYGFCADDQAVFCIKGGMALHAVVHCGEEQYDRPEVIFEPLVKFAQEHRFEQNGALYGNVLFVDCSGGVRKHFYDTYMIIG